MNEGTQESVESQEPVENTDAEVQEPVEGTTVDGTSYANPETAASEVEDSAGENSPPVQVPWGDEQTGHDTDEVDDVDDNSPDFDAEETDEKENDA